MAEPQATSLSSLSGTDNSEGKRKMKKKIDIAAVPELRHQRRHARSVKQKEVGGPLCLGVVVAIVIAL